MKMCKLKNGAIEPAILVTTTMMNIQLLAKNTENLNASLSILSIYDLGKKAHDSSYKMYGPCEEILKDLALVESNGEMSTTVKNIAQSAISFNGEWPVLDNPVVEILGDN